MIQDSTRLEAEARQDMGMKMEEKHEKALEEAKPEHALAEQESQVSHDEMLKHLSNMLGDHPAKDAVMAHVGKMMEMKHLGEVAPEHAESVEKEMSALVKRVNSLQTDTQSLIELVGEIAGIKSADLE